MKLDIKSLIIGIVFGFIIGGTVVVYADIGVLWNSSNVPVGVTGNPIYIQGV